MFNNDERPDGVGPRGDDPGTTAGRSAELRGAELRATFARHEELVPSVSDLRVRIDAAVVRRRQRRLGARAAAVAVLVTAALAVPFTVAGLINPGRSAPPLIGTSSPDTATSLDLLVLGVDTRPGSDLPGRADSVLVVHVPASRDRAYVISFERDSLVAIPGYTSDKINSAYAVGARTGGKAGGFALTARTLTQLTQVSFDAGVLVDFAGLQGVTDAVGGVDMCVDQRTVSAHIGVNGEGEFLAPVKGGRPVVYLPGCRHFVGWEALDYLRQRKDLANGAYDRDRHVIDYLVALLAKARANPAKLPALAMALGKLVTVDTGAHSLDELISVLAGVRTVIGIANPTAGTQISSTGIDDERLDPAADDALYSAIRSDSLDEWLSAHPQ